MRRGTGSGSETEQKGKDRLKDKVPQGWEGGREQGDEKTKMFPRRQRRTEGEALVGNRREWGHYREVEEYEVSV